MKLCKSENKRFFIDGKYVGDEATKYNGVENIKVI